MTPILVIGRSGQLARELDRAARARDIPVQCLGRDVADLTQGSALARVIADRAPRVVINTAAYTAVDDAETDPAAAFALNRDGPAHLAAACRAADAGLVHISTDYVFDGTKTAPYREDDPTAPINLYGQSKCEGEQHIREILPRHVILRTAWLHSAFGTNFVKTMLRVGREKPALSIVADQHGSPTAARDLAGVCLDVAQRLMAEPAPRDGFGTFHCAGDGCTTWHGLAEEIFRGVRERQPERAIPALHPVTSAAWPTRARRPGFSCMDCARLAAIHGAALPPWREGVARTVAALLAEGW